MRIIGIMGRSGAGKHVVATSIAAVLDENGYSVKLDSFARDIKRAVRGADGLVDKVAERRTMQVLGAEARRRNPNGLVNELAGRNNLLTSGIPIPDSLLRSDPADILIIADIRDEHELQFCRLHGVVIFVSGSFEPLTGAAADHQSESLAKTCDALDVDFILAKQPAPEKLARTAATLIRSNLAAFLKNKEAVHAS